MSLCKFLKGFMVLHEKVSMHLVCLEKKHCLDNANTLIRTTQPVSSQRLYHLHVSINRLKVRKQMFTYEETETEFSIPLERESVLGIVLILC